MLTATEARKASVHGRLRKPSTNRSEVVKPTSNRPPTISQTQGMNFLSLDARRAFVTLAPHGDKADHRQQDRAAALPRCSWRCCSIGFPVAASLLHRWALAAWLRSMLRRSCSCLLPAAARDTRGARVIRDHAKANDANRVLLLGLTGIVMAVHADRDQRRGGWPQPAAADQGVDHRHAGAGLAVRQHRLRLPLRPHGLQQAGRRLRRARFPAHAAPRLLGLRLFLLHLRDGVRNVRRRHHRKPHAQGGDDPLPRRLRLQHRRASPSPSTCCGSS